MSKPTTKKIPPVKKKKSAPNYDRFHWAQRISHAILLTSFSLLGLTGLPQKYPLAAWAQGMVRFFGGIETTRLIHHISATVLMLISIYHILDIGYKIFVRRVRLTMLPGIKDVIDAWQAFMYNLGFRKTRPQMGRYTFDEKMEYWALVWGTVIMGITGFLMWNPIAATRILPGEIIPAAKAAHGGEALLAVAAIVVWHMYSVHIKRFNKSMFTGKLTEEEMLHEHPLELADIKAGIADRPVDPKTLRKRQMVYWPIASILAAAMLLAVYGFVGSERTAAIPEKANNGPIYMPQVETSAAATEMVLTWDGSIGPLFQSTCGACHGTSSPSGLSFLTYADALQGGNHGPVILPGNGAGSPLVILQASGTHTISLNADQLTAVQEWIDAGAPEK